jgi:hypothetical protein
VTASIGREQSIAVLRFENLGNEPDNAYFADGSLGEKASPPDSDLFDDGTFHRRAPMFVKQT